jgi:hypothetical protein
MDTVLSIHDFSAAMTQEEGESQLVKMLRQLTAIEKPDVVRSVGAGAKPDAGWCGW